MFTPVTRPPLYAGLFILLLALPSAATDVAAGPVSGTWSAAGSPYVVLGHITVPDGETLTVDAGVEVRFDGPYALDVQGTLLANGTVSDTVLFTVNQGRVAWGHIEIGVNADSGSVLSYCKIERSNSTVHDSLYSRHGGGICMKGTHGARIEYSTVANCVGVYGGGIYADGAISIAGCTVRSCEAVNTHIQGRGGGISINGAAEILNCTVVGNSADFVGGGIDAGMPALVAGRSGDSRGLQGVIDGCVVAGNHSGYHGGGLGITSAVAGSQVTNNIVYGNTSVVDGGGVYFWYGNVSTFEYNTIARNEAPDGAGIAFGYTTSLSVEKSIIAFNLGEATKLVTSGSSMLIFDRVCAFGNEGGDALDGTNVMCITDDPLFCDIFDDDYSLCGNSPCRSGGPSGLMGALDVGCGNCDSAVQHVTWGRLKSLYR